MHVIKRKEKDKRKRQEGREGSDKQMNKQKSKVLEDFYHLCIYFVVILYQTSEHFVNIFPIVQPLEFNSHFSLISVLPIN